MQLAQDISSSVQAKKRRRSRLRRGFLNCEIGEIDKSRYVSYFPTDPNYYIASQLLYFHIFYIFCNLRRALP